MRSSWSACASRSCGCSCARTAQPRRPLATAASARASSAPTPHRRCSAVAISCAVNARIAMIWQRESTVGKTCSTSALVSRKSTPGGGSSSVLSSALTVAGVMLSTFRRMKMRRLPSEGARFARRITVSRIASIPSRRLPSSSSTCRTSGWVPCAILRHGAQSPQASPDCMSGRSQSNRHANSSASVVLPMPSGPVRRYA